MKLQPKNFMHALIRGAATVVAYILLTTVLSSLFPGYTLAIRIISLAVALSTSFCF